MITQFAQQYLVSLNFKGVQIFGRAFPTEPDARLWEQDALDAIESGHPIPCEKVAKYRHGKGLEQNCTQGLTNDA